MKILENNKKISCSFLIRFFIKNESGSLVKTIEREVNSYEMNVFPESNDLIRVDIVNDSETFNKISLFKRHPIPRYDFKGKNVIITNIESSNSEYPYIYIYQNVLVTFDKMNIKKYIPSTLSTFKDVDKLISLTNNYIRTLSLNDIVEIYLKTMTEGINLELVDYDL